MYSGQLCMVELSSVITLSLPFPLVFVEAMTESTLTSGSTRPELVREAPLLVEPAVAGILVPMSILLVLVPICAH